MRHWMALLTVFACVGTIACGPTEHSEEEGEGEESAAPQAMHSERNDVLFEATSPFEDLTEFATAGDEAAMDRTIAAIDQAAPATQSALSSEGSERFNSHLESIKSARASGDYGRVALESVEAYRVLVDGFDEAALVVPKAVSLLDYSGFRLQLLANAGEPDWQTIEQTAAEAAGFWAGIETRVEHKGLRDAMNTTIEGITEAVDARDTRLLGFAAQIDLDLVDLLEGYFAERAPSAAAR